MTDTLRDGTIDNLLVVLESGGRIAAQPRHSQRQRHDARQCDLFTLPGDDVDGLPQAAELGDHGGQGGRRPRSRPRSFRRRAAAVVRAQPAVASDFQHQPRQWRRHRLARARHQLFDPQGLRAGSALSLANGSEPGRNANPASLYRRAAGDRSQVPRAQQHRRVPGRRFPHLWDDRERQSRRDLDPQGRPRLFRSQWQVPAGPGVEHHRLAPGGERQDRHAPLRHHHRRPASKRHQRRADQPGFLHLDRRLGLPGTARRRCAEANPDRAAGDRRAFSAERRRRGQGRARGQQPVDHPARGTGHAARLRQRPLGFAAADPVGTRGDADRLRTRGRLSYRRRGKHARADLSRNRRLAYARHRGACGRYQMAVRRTAARRHPDPRSASPVRAHAADAEFRHSQRGCALGRPRRQQFVRAQPLPRLRPVGGRVTRDLRFRLVATSARTCRSRAPSAKATDIKAEQEFSRKVRGLRTIFRISLEEPGSVTGG